MNENYSFGEPKRSCTEGPKRSWRDLRETSPDAKSLSVIKTQQFIDPSRTITSSISAVDLEPNLPDAPSYSYPLGIFL